jgi:hypothetical protein
VTYRLPDGAAVQVYECQSALERRSAMMCNEGTKGCVIEHPNVVDWCFAVAALNEMTAERVRNGAIPGLVLAGTCSTSVSPSPPAALAPWRVTCPVCGDPVERGKCVLNSNGHGRCRLPVDLGGTLHESTAARFICVRQDGTSFRAQWVDILASTSRLDGVEYDRNPLDQKFYERPKRTPFPFGKLRDGMQGGPSQPLAITDEEVATYVRWRRLGGASAELTMRGDATSGDAPHVSVPCGAPGCNHTTVFPLGTLDPKEGRCTHVLMADPDAFADGLKCRGCGLRVRGETLAAAGFAPRRPYDERAMRLADECQKLKDENTKVLAENARLRRGKR